MITVPSLDPCTDILDTDEIMITHQNGTTDTISGANFNKRTQIISANSKTITGTPLKPSNVVRVFFTADITGSDTTTALALTYNGTSINVKVPKDGSLVKFTAQNMGGSPAVYKYCQAYTELDLYYDGTQFVIVGNPVVISDGVTRIQADGRNICTKEMADNNYLKNNKTIYIGSRDIDLVYGSHGMYLFISSIYSSQATVIIACSNYNTTGSISTLLKNPNSEFNVTLEHKSNGVDIAHVVCKASNYTWAVMKL